jgi:hypothetical protein
MVQIINHSLTNGLPTSNGREPLIQELFYTRSSVRICYTLRKLLTYHNYSTILQILCTLWYPFCILLWLSDHKPSTGDLTTYHPYQQQLLTASVQQMGYQHVSLWPLHCHCQQMCPAIKLIVICKFTLFLVSTPTIQYKYTSLNIQFIYLETYILFLIFPPKTIQWI